MAGEHLTDNQNHEGERYLGMLGLGHIAGQPIPGRPGLQMRDFLEICGEHARPLLAGLESLSVEDSRYGSTRGTLRGYISQFVGQQAPSEG